jgi:hypothetical protein
MGVAREPFISNNADCMIQRIVCVLLLTIGALDVTISAQSEIAPYATEADLGSLIGQKATVDGIFHKNAFNAPAIAISGRLFFLLENPPSKRTFDFPNDSRHAAVTGTLYLYDGNIQYVEEYQRIGTRYYFFNVDEAKIQFRDPLKANPRAENDPMTRFIGSWRFDAESTEANVFGLKDERAQKAYGVVIEMFRDNELVIGRDFVKTNSNAMGGKKMEPFTVLELNDSSLLVELKQEFDPSITGMKLEIDANRRLAMSYPNSRFRDFILYFTRW